MKERLVIVLVCILALALWGGLALLTNRHPPTAANQALFLVLFGAACGMTAIPVAYALDSRPRPWALRSDRLGCALRRGAFVSLLAMALMVLRLMRLLTAIPAVLLVFLVVTVEVALTLRRH